MNTMVIGYTTVVTIIQIIVSGGKLSTWKQGVPITMRTLRGVVNGCIRNLVMNTQRIIYLDNRKIDDFIGGDKPYLVHERLLIRETIFYKNNPLC